MKQRYMIVSHHRENDKLRIEDGKVVGMQPIHHLVAHYHWIRLDIEHIIMIAHCPIHTHTELHNHSSVSVLPSISSSKSVHSHFHKKITHHNKEKHLKALETHFSLDETHTMEDVVEMLETRYGQLFSPHH